MILARPKLFQRGRASLWLQASYWSYFAAVGCLVPYIALYYRHLGLTGPQIGVLSAVLPLGIALLAPLWGTVTDTFAAHRFVLRAALLLAALSALAVTRMTQFGPILIFMLLMAVAVSAVPTLLDAYAMTISDREGRSFGQLRVWGSIGFIVAVWFVGWYMGGSISNFFLIAYAAALLLGCAASFGLPPLGSRSTHSMWQGVSVVIRNRPVVLLLLTAYLVTTNASISTNFMGIYLTELGGSTRIVGTASALAAISELPMLIFGTRLIDRFSSRQVLLLAIGAYCVRYVCYSIPPSPGWALAVQLLHGLSFGAYLMASVTLVHQLAGQERAATAQGLLSSTSLGFGAITGALVGGALLDQIGAVGVFRVATGGMILATIVYVLSIGRLGADFAPAHAPHHASEERTV